MQFTALSALIAFAFALGTEAAAFASSSEGFATTVTFATPSSADHHGHGASSSFIGSPTITGSAAPSSAFTTTIAPSAAPTFVPGNGSGAFICFPVADGFAVPGLNGTVIFPNGGGPTASAFPSSAPITVVGSGSGVASSVFATGTVVASSAFATGTAVASSAFATGSAASSSAFATTF